MLTNKLNTYGSFSLSNAGKNSNKLCETVMSKNHFLNENNLSTQVKFGNTKTIFNCFSCVSSANDERN